MVILNLLHYINLDYFMFIGMNYIDVHYILLLMLLASFQVFYITKRTLLTGFGIKKRGAGIL